jgi:Zn-dependent protease with chaperone function
MHFLMILLALGTACFLRLVMGQSTGNLPQKWQHVLFSFFFPPLLLFMTALAVLCMGFDGQMLGVQANWLSYLVAIFFVSVAGISGIQKAYQGWQVCRQLRLYPQQMVKGKPARILPLALPYSAQIGFWKPELVVSQGVLDTLDKAHLEAVLAHEEAHDHYRDTFTFFWLGWLRSFTGWLPYTEQLWQDLLWLRELRADQKAAQQIDSLLLAESLLVFAKANVRNSPDFYAPFSCALGGESPQHRLTARIEALLDPDLTFTPLSSPQWSWSGFLLALLPWATVPLHYH